MLNIIRSLVRYTSSPRGAKVTVGLWILAVILISFLAPSAKDYESSTPEGSVAGDQPSEIAADILDEQFPSDDGLTALVVFNRDEQLTTADLEKIEQFSEWLASDDKPAHVASALPFHHFPEEVQDKLLSTDKSTLLYHVALEKDLESGDMNDVLQVLTDKMSTIGLDGMELEITGPAGIAADTVSIFQNADLVLMLVTIGLIFVILIIIYRSPLLAITPLLIAGIVYGVVDRVLGLVGKFDLFPIEGQAVSIMLILLFAVLTDYSLFIFSRYREELSKTESKYKSMETAIYHVSEPIFFSGGTIFIAMLTLFTTVFNAYNNFAPVFSIAVIFILIAGLTLIPAMFALMGRRAFWPFIPKVNEEKKERRGFWTAVSNIVKKRPAVITGTLLIALLIGAFNLLSMNFSFNLLKSFPEDMSSRKGFELLEENYPAGQLAPVSVIIESDEEITIDQSFLTNINSLQTQFEKDDRVSSVNSIVSTNKEDELPRNFLSENGKYIKFDLVLDEHPYEPEALDIIKDFRESATSLISDNGFESNTTQLHFAGQTANQLDIKQLNERDIIVLFSLIIVLLTLILGFQTRAVLLPILMMGTIVLSYVATLGFSWFIFENILGYDAVSYRLPIYAFVFMVALGIDYNIMLVSRIKELAETYSWEEAVTKGVALTGGVISSAGLILAATFSVLITQPLQELFLFGFIMAIGILLDTFIIRGFLLPSILLLVYKDGNAPGQKKKLT